MKERQIPFSAPMVRALLAGTKTQTRRMVKQQPERNDWGVLMWSTGRRGGVEAFGVQNLDVPPGVIARCPYGQPGDKLWVREAWRAPTSCDHLPPRSIADSEGRRFVADEVTGPDPGYGRFRQGMFMPRWASRITLEVAAVRVERLQDISEADCRAEGITDGGCTACGMPEPCGCVAPAPDAREAYCHLWQQLNGAESWAANPWVWVVEFREVPR